MGNDGGFEEALTLPGSGMSDWCGLGPRRGSVDQRRQPQRRVSEDGNSLGSMWFARDGMPSVSVRPGRGVNEGQMAGALH